MNRNAVGASIAAVVPLIVACAAGAMFLAGGSNANGCGTMLPNGPLPISAPPGGWAPVAGFDAEQVGHAATITAVGTRMRVPTRGQIIAVATALQESGLRNLAAGPDDSIGLFQQRPSQGWGTPQQLRDPVYTAGKFYQKLLTINGWQQMPLTQAAQAVQRSAYPNEYAKHEPAATRLVAAVTASIVGPAVGASNGTAPHASADSSLGDPNCSVATGPWTQPVMAAIVSGFRTAGRPGHDGVDLGAARGTPIRAAAGGTVSVVKCNVRPASHGCDIDGTPNTPGCGWYVDIDHAGGIITRYCHMLTRPHVHEGQTVTAGQVIGIVGSSGHSSGPHLHYEVHRGNHSPASATDPVAFMAAQGAPLGTSRSAS